MEYYENLCRTKGLNNKTLKHFLKLKESMQKKGDSLVSLRSKIQTELTLLEAKFDRLSNEIDCLDKEFAALRDCCEGLDEYLKQPSLNVKHSRQNYSNTTGSNDIARQGTNINLPCLTHESNTVQPSSHTSMYIEEV